MDSPPDLPPPTTRSDSLQQELDDLRGQLNASLIERRYDDAVQAARKLRDLLRAQPRLDARQLKSLGGAESVLRRFAQGSDNVTPLRLKWIARILLASLVIFVAIFLLVLARTSHDPYGQEAYLAMDALDRLDGAVSRGVTLPAYDAEVRAAKEVCVPFFKRYQSERKGDVALRAMVSAFALYKGVLADWTRMVSTARPPTNGVGPTSAATSTAEPVPFGTTTPAAAEPSLQDRREPRISPDARLSSNDVTSPTGFPRMWLAAHTIEACALARMRGERPMASNDRTTPATRLAGHWSDGSTDIYYGALNAGTNMGWAVRTIRNGSVDVGAYELANALPGSVAIALPDVASKTGVNIDKKDEIVIVKYMPQMSLVVARVLADRYSEWNTQLLRLDNKTLP